MFEKKEAMIREARTIEAMKKGLMGAEGKFARIAKMMGDPIYQQGSSIVESRYLDDPYVVRDENEILTMDEDDMSFLLGWHFDGMRRGVHMEIMYRAEFREIKCRYGGNVVYTEVSGELVSYSPGDWEEKLEALFEATKRQERVEKKVNNQWAAGEAKKKQAEFLDLMKKKWGI